MAGGKKGTLIIIGGAEDKIRNKAILEEVARLVGSGKLGADRRPKLLSKPLAEENQQKSGPEVQA